MRQKFFVPLFLTAFLAVALAAPAASASADYVGVWVLMSQKKNGAPVTPPPAKTLVLEEHVFNMVTLGVCGFTGTMDAQAGQFRVNIQVSSCLAPENPGSQMVYSYSAAGGALTLSYAKAGTTYHEVYGRQTPGGPEACTHPYCGTWNRVSTLVDGALMHNEPAYTVITSTTYYSIASAFYNKCTIDNVAGNKVTITMKSHNCPVGPTDPTPPGTVLTATWKLSDQGQTLTIHDSNYGPTVTTVFKKLQ